MALTNMTVADQANDDSKYIDVVTFNGDASYATGGAAFEALFKAAVGHDRKIMSAFGYGGDNTVEFLPASGKLLMRAAGGAEVPNATNLAAVLFRITVLSR
jgi:hypothetical protein